MRRENRPALGYTIILYTQYPVIDYQPSLAKIYPWADRSSEAVDA
jgi:hypothetical protein